MHEKCTKSDDEISVYTLLERIRNGWKTIILGVTLGMAAAYASVITTAPKYEAVALLQGGQVAMWQPPPIQLIELSAQIESSAQVVERIRTAAFQARVFQKAAAQGRIFAQVIKSTSTDRSPLIELKILADTPDHLTKIGETVVAELVNVQEQIFRTRIKLLENEIRLLEERVVRAESELDNISRQVNRAGGQATVERMTILAALRARHVEEISMLRGQALAAKAALSSTHQARTIEPFTVAGPLSSNARLMLLVGALSGLIAGCFLVLAVHTWRREKQAWNERSKR